MPGKNKSSRSGWFALIVPISVFLGYIVCYVSIKNAIFPFSPGGASLVLRNFYRGGISNSSEKNKQKEWLDIAFSGNVSSSRSFYPPAETLSDVRDFNRRIYFPRRRFPEAFDGISVKSHYLLNNPDYPPVSVIQYEVDGYARKAFVYGKINSCSFKNNSNKSVLFLIPGSGDNQSSGAYFGDAENYHHGIRDIAVQNSLDYLVLIKPIRLFSYTNKDGSKKLSFDFVLPIVYRWKLFSILYG